MGLSRNSTGKKVKGDFKINKKSENDKIIALAGNPNVGKSTVFNALTGMNQHTGNWPGKTVENAQGFCKHKDKSYLLVDIPGTYSLFSHSPEEEIARNFICFGGAEKTVIVCDATNLERNLNLVLQTLEITRNVIICVNLLDEAKRKGININLQKLSEKLGVKVIGTIAHKKRSLEKLKANFDSETPKEVYTVRYPKKIEDAISVLEPLIENATSSKFNVRWLCINLLLDDNEILKEIEKYLGFDIKSDKNIEQALDTIKQNLKDLDLKDIIVTSIFKASEDICKDIIDIKHQKKDNLDRKLDYIFTSRKYGYPIMLLLLLIIFWITIIGANYISGILSSLFDFLENQLQKTLLFLGTPLALRDFIIEGIYRVPTLVVSVMLPPMAIFFPLFTLLEDSGYLPRIAFNLDKPFKSCRSCGKNALTMCMGFGCNAAGVVGCRIINSKRERMLSMLTNSLVPCNGRFPTLIALISMFFVVTAGFSKSILSSVFLTLFIVLSIMVTFLSTYILSRTILKGEPSSYILEMPPYRKPQIRQVIVRSIFDRTIFVLMRSITVSIPAGIIIYLLANTQIDNVSVLKICSDFLDPFAIALGLDGVILIAFILGFPANETVIPIMLMGYLGNSTLTKIPNLTTMKEILISNGWTIKTALCTTVFLLFHWPCSTTVLTIKKESGSAKIALLSTLLPTIIGIIFCFLINLVFFYL